MSPNLVEQSLRKSLADLQLDYIDLYLMHWPMAFEVCICYAFSIGAKELLYVDIAPRMM